MKTEGVPDGNPFRFTMLKCSAEFRVRRRGKIEIVNRRDRCVTIYFLSSSNKPLKLAARPARLWISLGTMIFVA